MPSEPWHTWGPADPADPSSPNPLACFCGLIHVVVLPQGPLGLLRHLHGRGDHRRRRRPRLGRRHHSQPILALRGVRIVMAVRNVSAGFKAREAIQAETPGAKVDVLELDLSSMDSVRRFASEFDALNLSLSILRKKG